MTNQEASNQFIQEDEIDLRELFAIIRKNKIIIILITTIITILALGYAITKPNEYMAELAFASTKTDDKLEIVPEQLQGYINLNIGSTVSPEISYEKLLGSYEFMKKFILKYKLYDSFEPKNEVYPFGLNLSKDKISFQTDENNIYNLYEEIKSSLEISKNKKNAIISFKYTSTDRFFNKIVLDSFITEASKTLYQRDLKDLNLKISNFRKEMLSTKELILRNKLAELVTVLMQKRVFLTSDTYYGLKMITNSEVAYKKDKTGPKRALIIIVAFITGLMLSIFFVFLLEFTRGTKSK